MKPIKKSNQNDPGEMTLAEFEELAKTDPNAAENFLAEIYQGNPEMQKKLAEMMDNLEQTLAEFELFRELRPYLEQELEKINPDYRHMTPAELEAAGILGKATERAREAWEQDLNAAPIRADKIEYPLDKPNQKIWNLLETPTDGQIVFNLAPRGSKLQLPAYYSIDFDALGENVKISKRLQPFDKRVYIAISALFNAGNTIMSLTQIHYAMGNTTRPKTGQLQKINESITKMTGARISFDNIEEAEKLKGYPSFKYDGSLLPLERGTATINGRLADAAIRIFREPPLISFAKGRKQFTTISIKLLQSPANKTNENVAIEDYLIERIAWAKSKGDKKTRILLNTLYENAGISTPKQKTRAPEKIKRYLDYQQGEKFFRQYAMDDKKIDIYL